MQPKKRMLADEIGNLFQRGSLVSSGCGRLAQRLAHLVYTEVVGGSNPSTPTIFPQGLRHDARQFFRLIGLAQLPVDAFGL